MTDYTTLTEEQRKEAHWQFSLLNVKAKARRKVLKDNPPVDQMALEWQGEINRIGDDIRANTAEIKAIYKATGLT